MELKLAVIFLSAIVMGGVITYFVANDKRH
jgi:uncharacterized integral membrane protein